MSNARIGFKNAQNQFEAATLGATDVITENNVDTDAALQTLTGNVDGLRNDVTGVQGDISDMRTFIGYTQPDILGLEVDFRNRAFNRLAGARHRTPGTGFDDVECFGGRRRCIVADDGVILAYHGETAYTETGKLTAALTVNGTSYALGTTVQVMVYQPKFFYKVVPLSLDPIADGKGFHMRKVAYYISATPKSGFKVHPAFIKNGVEKNYVLIGAYEGCLQQGTAYNTTDTQTGNFTAGTGDKLSSIANAKPASGLTRNFTRRNCGITAENRGAGWSQLYGQIASATQMLMMIEYGTLNTQSAIGRGVVDFTDDAASNMSILTGATSSLGNATGAAAGLDGQVSVSYRGEENPWGNIWKFVDGILTEPFGRHELWIADNNFSDPENLPAPSHYKNAGITLAKANGYVSAFAYNEPFDWLFFPSETLGDSNLPVGDHFWQDNTYEGGFLLATLGALWHAGSGAGGFCWYVNGALWNHGRLVGGRLVYVPA